jgi:hypothetical protein
MPLDVRRGASPVKRLALDFVLPAAPGYRYSARLRRRSSVVERILGKAEVSGSSPDGGTMFPQAIDGLGKHLPSNLKAPEPLVAPT